MKKKVYGKSTLNFNKQILLGEVGAVIFAPLIAFLASKVFSDPSTISRFAVVGSIIGAGIFWIITRINDNSENKNYAKKELMRDMSYFTPAAFILTLLLYYPSLYFLSNYFLGNEHRVWSSVIFAQLVGFSLFLLGINIYRYILGRFFNKKI